MSGASSLVSPQSFSPAKTVNHEKPGPSWLRTIACVSTSRADAGIFRPLLKQLGLQRHWRTVCLAGGTHLAEEYGQSLRDLHGIDRVEVNSVAHQVAGDTAAQVAETAGRAVIEFARAFERLRPDLVFVLGDRTEMLAAALAATICALPIAHLHGGDVTLGAYDDACRNALTKLAHLHFPALPRHAERIMALGEAAWRVRAVGAPALDALDEFLPLSIMALQDATGLDFSRPAVIVCLHPETLSGRPSGELASAVLAAVEPLDVQLLLVAPNADVGREAVARAMQELAQRRPHTVFRAHLAQPAFWSCLHYARALVGNSSAGILEAASFRLPVVNVGDRQKGRLRPANVIDVAADPTAVAAQVRRAMSVEFRRSLEGLQNPYGDHRAAERIVVSLSQLPERRADVCCKQG